MSATNILRAHTYYKEQPRTYINMVFVSKLNSTEQRINAMVFIDNWFLVTGGVVSVDIRPLKKLQLNNLIFKETGCNV